MHIQKTIGTNISIRLIQVHMCVIYLFSAIGKLKGEPWWDGEALIMAVFNREYQSVDATWLVHYPLLVAALTQITVFWEAAYCVLVWPRLTRPIMLAIAAGVHLGIGMFLGMWTFGLAMLIGNLAFVSPWVVRRLFGRIMIDSSDVQKMVRENGTLREVRGSKKGRGAKPPRS